jgi:hypothetical protein
MNFRRWLAFLNLALFGVGIAAEFLLPQYSAPIFYALLAWMFVSLLIFYGPGSRVGMARPTPSAAPLPSAPGASGPPTRIGFCVYCGTELPAGALNCPACGRAAKPI